MEISIKGFLCRKCGKAFFAVSNDPDSLKERRTAIRKYEKKGYELVDVDTSSLDGWCRCATRAR